jgi:hypothetical protein
MLSTMRVGVPLSGVRGLSAGDVFKNLNKKYDLIKADSHPQDLIQILSST